MNWFVKNVGMIILAMVILSSAATMDKHLRSIEHLALENSICVSHYATLMPDK